MIITTDKPMRERDLHDFYPTPLALCDKALGLVNFDSNYQPYRILDPGAGTGVWGAAASRRWLEPAIVGIELRQVEKPADYDMWHCTDYLAFNFALTKFDLVIGNPPYKHAEQFVRKSHALLTPQGEMIFLLRLAFLEGQARGKGLWCEIPPRFVYVLSKRPSFITEGDKKGKTDATAYALFHWVKGDHRPTTLSWLDW